MSNVTDLDVVVPEAKTVRFGGQEYAVPADMPMEIFLRINKASEHEDNAAQVDALVDTIADLFTWEMEDVANPDPEQIAAVKANVRKLIMRRGTRYGFGLVRAIYKEDDEAADAAAAESAEADPTSAEAPSAEDSSGMKSSTTSQSPTTPTVIRADQAVS